VKKSKTCRRRYYAGLCKLASVLRLVAAKPLRVSKAAYIIGRPLTSLSANFAISLRFPLFCYFVILASAALLQQLQLHYYCY